MVKSNRVSGTARVARKGFLAAMKLWGRDLTRRLVTRNVDENGKLTGITTSDATFTGDLQFGPDLDQRFVSAGIVEVGEGVLYTAHNSISPIIAPQDQIVDGNSIWEVLSKIDSPEINAAETCLSYRCVRRINANDN